MGINTTRGADEGTRTHTLTHENLNLACLPIPSHLHIEALITQVLQYGGS